MQYLNKEENSRIQSYSQFILFYFMSIYIPIQLRKRLRSQKSEYDTVPVDFYMIHSFFNSKSRERTTKNIIEI